MSLATSGGMGAMGGAGAGGGLAMAHGGAMAQPMQGAPPPGGASIPMGMAPPSTSAAALGADLVDKQQQISLKQVRDLSHLPLVAIDLYSSQPHVASFPPKNKDPAAVPGAPSLIGKMKDKVLLQSSESSHKTFRKWLSKSKGYSDLQADVFAKADDKSAVAIESPQKWLGYRRLDDAPECLRSQVNLDKDSEPSAIAEEGTVGVGVSMANGTLDGSVPQGDDFDRVVAKVRLHASKKALTVLPEEAAQLVLNQAQHHVAKQHKVEDEDEIINFPCCVAVPAPYCTDSAMEAMLDATNGTGVLLQRSVCALAGALLPSAEEGKPNLLLEHILKVLQALQKEFQKQQLKNPNARFEEEQVVLLAGTTKDTVECTAIQISTPQRDQEFCIFGHFKVLCNVSYQHEKPESIITKCISELFDVMDAVAPEVDGPIAMVTYGTSEEQKAVADKWEKAKKSLEDWEDVPQFYSKPDSVAMGTSVLGAVSHGRLKTIVQVEGKKPKAALALNVQNVAPVAVGIQMNYHGGAKNKWQPVKTIFDFDRRVPAGPYDVDISAATGAVYQEQGSDLSDEALFKATTEMEASKYIPKREIAALDLRVQVVQKWTRDGVWKKIGDVQSPLVMTDKDGKKTACERIKLELSLSSVGLITHSLVGERETVVQATKSARNSKIRYYGSIILAIAFFGGFLVKSYWEERVFERDTRRLLAYYKHVVPGSMSDGDLYNARYVVYKYRNKKEKLWKNLEKKYGEPCLQEWEWPEEEETPAEEEEMNLDEGDEKKEEEATGEQQGKGEQESTEEPDL
ncbi:unnamed protein product [Cylindrotheca closterium]|uniref:Uncharacterized protein n=1 Tax=Cylindrotheca closterium TaxID=2856 RepID=A0AAD2GC21_9STRA|nr:unnamed protein product [Cylindrotheca closterium]